MKKNFITSLLFAAVAIVSLTFTACGEEVNIDDSKTSLKTEFVTEADDATRTTINNGGYFYWEIGDKIWVDNGTTWLPSSQSNITTGKTARAKFIIDGTFTTNGYPVRYTGYTGQIGKDTTETSYSTVTIADQQTQSAWNDGTHLSVSGDCGTGTAIKQPSGFYKFTLKHQASYLLLYPYLSSALSGNYTLEKVEILTDGSSNLAGEYDFTNSGLNGVATDGVAIPKTSTGKSQITLACKNGFGLRNTVPDPTNYNSPSNHLFVVIAPGIHTLTVIYTVKNSENQTLEFIYDIDAQSYEANKINLFTHELHHAIYDSNFVFVEVRTYYRWGAIEPYNSATGAGNYDPSTTATSGFWAQSLSYSDGQLYIGDSDEKYYDNAIKWDYRQSDGTTTTRRGGWWLKKKAFHSGTRATSRAIIKGKPTESKMNQYFFIPSIHSSTDPILRFWMKNAPNESYGYTLELTSLSVSFPVRLKANSYVVPSISINEDGTTPWFQ